MGVEKVASSALWSPLHPSVLFRWHEQSIGKSYQTSSPTRGYALKHVKAFHPLLDSQIPHMATNEGYVLLGCGVIATPFRFLQCGYVFRHSTCQLILIMTDVKKLHNTRATMLPYLFVCYRLCPQPNSKIIGTLLKIDVYVSTKLESITSGTDLEAIRIFCSIFIWSSKLNHDYSTTW